MDMFLPLLLWGFTLHSFLNERFYSLSLVYSYKWKWEKCVVHNPNKETKRNGPVAVIILTVPLIKYIDLYIDQILLKTSLPKKKNNLLETFVFNILTYKKKVYVVCIKY